MSSIARDSNSDSIKKFLEEKGFAHLKKSLSDLNGKELLSKDRKFFEQLERGTDLYNLLHPPKKRFNICEYNCHFYLFKILLIYIYLYRYINIAILSCFYISSQYSSFTSF